MKTKINYLWILFFIFYLFFELIAIYSFFSLFWLATTTTKFYKDSVFYHLNHLMRWRCAMRWKTKFVDNQIRVLKDETFTMFVLAKQKNSCQISFYTVVYLENWSSKRRLPPTKRVPYNKIVRKLFCFVIISKNKSMKCVVK